MAFSQLCLPLCASHQLFPAFGAVLMLFTDERLSSRHSFFIIVCCDFYLQLLPSTAAWKKRAETIQLLARVGKATEERRERRKGNN